MRRPIQLKRTFDADKPPDALADGEVALGLGNDPIRVWSGTPTGVVEFGAKIRELEERIAALEAA